MKIITASWRVLRAVLLGLAGLVIFLEEWGWRPLTALVARLFEWPPLGRLENRVASSPPRVALALFLVPTLLLLPVKLGAFWLIEAGRPGLGFLLVLAAKLVGTAFVGRLFILVEAQLMQFGWLARFIEGWRGVKLRVRVVLRASALWQAMWAWRRSLRLWLQRGVG